MLYPIIKIGNKKTYNIFTYYYTKNKSERACITEFNIKNKAFEKYIKNPHLGFYINSLADGIWAILWPIIFLIGYPLWFFTNRKQ